MGGKYIDLAEYLPQAILFNVSAFDSNINYYDITVPMRSVSNDQYAVFLKVQTNIQYNTEPWLTGKIVTKVTDNFTVRIYNEQKRAIEASTWAALVVPII